MASPAYSVPLKNDYNAVEQEGQAYSTIVTNQARVMLELIAPANLPEGYNLQVESSGERYSVIVPPGGVLQGQKFTAQAETIPSPNQGPVGAWKDGLFDCFKYGICHPHLCLATFFRPIALAQVMVRMRLDWCGVSATVSSAAKTFKTVCILTVLYFLLDQALAIASDMLLRGDPSLSGLSYADFWYEALEEGETTYSDGTTTRPVLPIGFYILHYTRELLGYAFLIYFIVAGIRTRRTIREKFSIPEEKCVGCEDAICVACCGCCTVMQMSRHTADYDAYPGQCCTETGLPSHVNAMVV